MNRKTKTMQRLCYYAPYFIFIIFIKSIVNYTDILPHGGCG